LPLLFCCGPCTREQGRSGSDDLNFGADEIDDGPTFVHIPVVILEMMLLFARAASMPELTIMLLLLHGMESRSAMVPAFVD